ncbi:MAG: ABC transporter permease [Microcystaceae cyanobacterium]
MDIKENLKMALSAVTSNKLRSLLTILGIAIGNGSVIAMVAVGQGAQQVAREQFEALGADVIFVSLTATRIRRRLSSKAKPLLLSDAEAIASQVKSVAEVSPERHINLLVSYKAENLNIRVVGTTPEFTHVRNYEMAKGRFFNEADMQRNHRVVVLGYEVATRLFKQTNPVNQTVRINNLNFTVIGVTKPKGILFDSNQDNQVFTPLTTMSAYLVRWKSPYGIPLNTIALTPKENRISSALFQVRNLMRLRHPITTEDDLRISTQQAVLEQVSKTEAGLTRMLAAIASISLLVGGIGVMNIMLVSVTERTQEIGLRKAIGAKEKDILFQFLIEAVLLAILGGALGIGLGAGGITVARSFTQLAARISPVSIVVAVGVSGGIGLCFGVIPAQRAARLDPIIALRRM